MSLPIEERFPGGLRAAVVTVFLVLVGSIAVLDLASALWFPIEVDESRGNFGKRQSGTGFWGGEPLRWYESKLEERSFSAEQLRPRWAELTYLTLNHTSGRSLAGKDGWFFLQSTLEPLPKADQAILFFSRWLSAMELALATKDIGLVTAVVPSKATMYPEFLPLGTSAIERTYEPFIEGLRDAGLDVVDVRAALLEAKARGETTFYKTDTHWDLAGSYIGAGAIAKRLTERFGELDPRINPRVEIINDDMQVGDLVRMAGFTPGGFVDRSTWYYYDRPHVSMERPRGLLQCYLAGDSFAASCYLARNLSGHLKAFVGDVSRNGKGLAHGLGEAFPGLVHDDLNDVRVFVLAFVERQLRETPELNFSEVVRGMGVFYSEHYHELYDLTEKAGGSNYVAMDLPQFVLPANGTTAVRFETRHTQDRMLGVKSFESHPNFMMLPKIPVAAGDGVTYFPLVHPRPVTGVTYIFEGAGLTSGESTRVSLVTAYSPHESLAGRIRWEGGSGSGPRAHPGGEGRVEIDLPQAVPADGRFALGFRLERSAHGGARGAIFERGAGATGDSGRPEPVGDPFPISSTPGSVAYILPLVTPNRMPLDKLELHFDAEAGDMEFTDWTLLAL